MLKSRPSYIGSILVENYQLAQLGNVSLEAFLQMACPVSADLPDLPVPQKSGH